MAPHGYDSGSEILAEDLKSKMVQFLRALADNAYPSSVFGEGGPAQTARRLACAWAQLCRALTRRE